MAIKIPVSKSRCWLPLLLCCCMAQQALAQSASFLGDGIQDYIRRSQLLGKVNRSEALALNSFATGLAAVDSLLPLKPLVHTKPGAALAFRVLPAGATVQFNSHHPYGSNDGSMIPARGWQTLFSAGFKASLGSFSLTVKPEWVLAQNKDFETFPTEHYPVYWKQYYRWLNTADIPERFGSQAYNRIFAGQSSLRFNTGAFSVGVSTENTWWGPGRFNALVLSNNAPGFLHATIQTTRPVKTGIGSFEGQLIGGNLRSSGILPPDRFRYDDSTGLPLYQPKPTQNRSLLGMMLSWQPKWTPGLFLGFTTVTYGYRSAPEPYRQKAHIGSLFARYVMPADKAELYFEYGRNDKTPNPVNLLAENGYPRAYVAGFRKLFAGRKKQFIEFAAEFTQLQLPTGELTFEGGSWYTSKAVPHGFTHEGQILGSGIGPGSNSQLLDISYIKGFDKFGIKLERIVRNNDFYYNAFVTTLDFTRHWVDLSTTLHANWQYRRLHFSSQLALVRSLNYQWYILEGLGYFKNGYDVLNLHGSFSMTYRF